MVVKIRFGRGPVVARRKGKNSRIALLGAGLLTLVSICLASLGFWRLSQDVGLAGDFIFSDGLLSHWQVWIAATCLSWYCCWRLSRYARQGRDSAADAPDLEAGHLEAANVEAGEPKPAGLAANM